MLQPGVVVREIHARIGLSQRSMVEYDQRQSIVLKCDTQTRRERESVISFNIHREANIDP